jgi:nickel/cobalt transporter (NicO) family protein
MHRFSAALAAALALLLAFAFPAFAHPHIFVDAKATVVFNDAGDVIGVRHQWTFDEAFSAWSIQGLDTNNDGVTSEAELQSLADENMKGLGAYSYYTYMGEAGAPNLTFHHLPNPRLDYADGRTTLKFTLALDKPYHIKKRLQLGIEDSEYYVAITFAGPEAISLENAPAGCRATLIPPRDLPPDLASRLYALGADVTQLPPDLEAAMRGMQGEIDISCDYSVTGPRQNPSAEGLTVANAPTATDAANALAATKPIPFGGPPRELGFGLPQTGVLGWILTQQKEFYRLLTDSLTRLKTDNWAFIVLGSLSFFYGIFHAAGPGHGKVVISSYVLANERQYRQGMMLSFASSMLASLVAVLFILVAALVLNLTGDAMGNAANWIGIGSYLMVALLGLWLMIRHIFGIGHRHRHAADKATDDRQDRRLARRHLFDEADDHGHPHHDHHHHGHAHGHDHPHAEAPRSALARAFETSSRQASSRRGAAEPAYAYAEAAHGHAHAAHDGDDDHEHGHSHVAVTPDQIRHGTWREALGVVLAIGLRPCSGALVVLVFALSQGVLWAGIASVFLMGFGTAITVAALATLAMTAKGMARRLSRGRPGVATRLVWWGELTGAFMVFALGILLTVANLWG